MPAGFSAATFLGRTHCSTSVYARQRGSSYNIQIPRNFPRLAAVLAMHSRNLTYFSFVKNDAETFVHTSSVASFTLLSSRRPLFSTFEILIVCEAKEARFKVKHLTDRFQDFFWFDGFLAAMNIALALNGG